MECVIYRGTTDLGGFELAIAKPAKVSGHGKVRTGNFISAVVAALRDSRISERSALISVATTAPACLSLQEKENIVHSDNPGYNIRYILQFDIYHINNQVSAREMDFMKKNYYLVILLITILEINIVGCKAKVSEIPKINVYNHLVMNDFDGRVNIMDFTDKYANFYKDTYIGSIEWDLKKEQILLQIDSIVYSNGFFQNTGYNNYLISCIIDPGALEKDNIISIDLEKNILKYFILGRIMFLYLKY
ncbi:MAG: hypothetical protein LBU32_32250 [Clostridiales bacterium]|nr:hypothetical protein [Clostridiales bacterium]